MSEIKDSNQKVKQAQAEQRIEVLVFTLGEEHYALDILKVQEIRGYERVTRVANSPDFIKGVTNLRGVIVPIVDLRIKFGIDEPEYNDQTVVIVLNIGQRVVGIVVDSVSDVVTLSPDQIKPSPSFDESYLSEQYLQGLININDQMLILVDIDKLMTSPEMAIVADEPE